MLQMQNKNNWQRAAVNSLTKSTKLCYGSNTGFKFFSAKEYAEFVQFEISIPCWDHRFTSTLHRIKLHELLELQGAKQITLF